MMRSGGRGSALGATLARGAGGGASGSRGPGRLVTVRDSKICAFLSNGMNRSAAASTLSDPPRNRNPEVRSAKWNVSIARSCIDRFR